MPYEYLIAANTFKFPNNNFGPIHATLFYFINALSLHSCMNHMSDANTTINHCTCCFRCMSASWVCMTHCIFIILSLSLSTHNICDLLFVTIKEREKQHGFIHNTFHVCNVPLLLLCHDDFSLSWWTCDWWWFLGVFGIWFFLKWLLIIIIKILTNFFYFLVTFIFILIIKKIEILLKVIILFKKNSVLIKLCEIFIFISKMLIF